MASSLLEDLGTDWVSTAVTRLGLCLDPQPDEAMQFNLDVGAAPVVRVGQENCTLLDPGVPWKTALYKLRSAEAAAQGLVRK